MGCFSTFFKYRAFLILTFSFSSLGFLLMGGSFQDLDKLQTLHLADGETEAQTLMTADLLPDLAHRPPGLRTGVHLTLP